MGNKKSAEDLYKSLTISGSDLLKMPDFDPLDGDIFGDWEIDVDGDLVYKNGKYVIEKKRLKECDWIIHLLYEDWVNWNDFIPAYISALKRIGIKSQKITISY